MWIINRSFCGSRSGNRLPPIGLGGSPSVGCCILEGCEQRALVESTSSVRMRMEKEKMVWDDCRMEMSLIMGEKRWEMIDEWWIEGRLERRICPHVESGQLDLGDTCS